MGALGDAGNPRRPLWESRVIDLLPGIEMVCFPRIGVGAGCAPHGGTRDGPVQKPERLTDLPIRRVFAWAHNEHRTRSVPGDLGRDRAEQQTAESAEAA